MFPKSSCISSEVAGHPDECGCSLWSQPLTRDCIWRFSIWSLRVTLAIILIIASAAKAVDPASIMQTLRVNHLPENLLAPSAYVVAGIELIVATILVVAASGPRPLLFAAGLFAIFAVQLIYLKSQNVLTCNCLGAILKYEATNRSMLIHVVIDTAIVSLCVALNLVKTTNKVGTDHACSRVYTD